MVRGYERLQNKLEELASDLRYVVALPVETPHHKLLSVSEVMNARFAFLKKLISAEVKSHPQGPKDLHEIVQKYEGLKFIFKDWYSSRISSIDHPNSDTDSIRSCIESGSDVIVEDGGGGNSPDHDNASTQFRTESSLNNDILLEKDGDGDGDGGSGGGGGGDGGSHDIDAPLYKDPPGMSFKSMIQEEQEVATVKAEGYGHWERKREESILRLSGNKTCAVISGVVMLSVAVAGVVIASFCESRCYGSEMQGFLPPT